MNQFILQDTRLQDTRDYGDYRKTHVGNWYVNLNHVLFHVFLCDLLWDEDLL